MPTADAAKAIAAADPNQAWERATAALSNLGAALSGPQIPGITSSLNSSADALSAAAGPVGSFSQGLVGFQNLIDNHTIQKMLGIGSASASTLAESARGRGPRSPQTGPRAYYPPPPVSVSVAPPAVRVTQGPSTTTVLLDGEQIAARLEQRIGSWISSAIGVALRTVNGAASFDSGAHWSPPDAGGFGIGHN